MSLELRAIEAVIAVDGTVTLADVPKLTHPAKAIVTVMLEDEAAEPTAEELGIPEDELRFLKALKAKGLIREIKPVTNRAREFEPIVISGPPLSQSIIEDRE